MYKKHRLLMLPLTAGTMMSMPPTVHAQALEEIVVTAQRRVENIQDVAIAITAVSGDQLDDFRVQNIENIGAISPSITFNKTNMASSSSNIMIRGIGTSGSARSFEGAVGVFIDGAYRSRSGQALSNFLDIDQLQILKGPQGTLFGKNTAAGALLLDSVTPDTEEVSGNIRAELGNYDHYQLRGVLNTPLGDRAALRIAGLRTERDGFFERPDGDSVDDEDDYSVKGQLLFRPVDSLELRLIADKAKTDNNCCYGTNDEIDGPLQPLIDSLTVANGFGVPSKKRSDFEAVLNPEPKNEVEDSGFTLYAKWDTEHGVLKYIGSYRNYTVDQLQDSDFSGADIVDVTEEFESELMTHEISFNGVLDKGIEADFLFGIFYSTEDLDIQRHLNWGTQAQTYWDIVFGVEGLANAAIGQFSIEDMEGTADSTAVFTHWDIVLNNELSLILGLRYTSDEKDGAYATDFFRYPLFDPLALAGVMPGITYDDDFDDDSFSGTIALQYMPTEDAMVYASYNRGYKAGGVNMDVNAAGGPGSPVTGIPPSLGSPVYKSETVDSFEVGLKMDWLEGRARTNVAVFYNDITDLQIATFVGLQFDIANAPEGEVYGIELDGLYQLSKAFQVSGGVTWLPTAKYGDDESLQNLIDRDFPNTPELAVNFTLTGDHYLTNDLELSERLEVIYRDEVYTNTTNNLTEDSVTLVNISVGIGSISSGWDARLWAQNVTDEDYVTRHFNTPLQGDDRNAFIGSPRTYGVTVSYDF